ncbi:MAG TPA: AAA family ATPase, partial [Acidimicrobiales bacterium]|nr:AAA family ATPase [Acidimicrobiales bacterium]
MLVEIRVRDLGVIEDLILLLGPGMTALTGETGAGKTLVVEALELLVGGRADAALVRSGAGQAVVEGRFSGASGIGSDEVIVTREIPAEGRSRAYVDGRMATVAALSDLGDQLVDLHGQHAHQSLLHQAAQRQALDHFGGISTSEVDDHRAKVLDLGRRLAEIGGDGRQLAREVDLLRFQVTELERAALGDPDEGSHLEAEESLLAAAEALRLAVQGARCNLIGGEGTVDQIGAADLIGMATTELGAHGPL